MGQYWEDRLPRCQMTNSPSIRSTLRPPPGRRPLWIVGTRAADLFSRKRNDLECREPRCIYFGRHPCRISVDDFTRKALMFERLDNRIGSNGACAPQRPASCGFLHFWSSLMPSTSKAQAHLMAAVAHGWEPPGRNIPKSVGQEFHAADKKVGKWEHPGNRGKLEKLRGKR